MDSQMLQDPQGRLFRYLRLSITDACNFSCQYCLPNGYQKPTDWEAPLNMAEISNLVLAFSSIGFQKVRLTGGEPTLRSDLVSIIENIAKIPAIQKIALSTNGFRLEKKGDEYVRAGVSLMNISIDTLNSDRFAKLTRFGGLASILKGIDQLIESGHCEIKVNAVLLRDTMQADIQEFLAWIKHRPVTVRWIELMQTGSNKIFFDQQHHRGESLQMFFENEGWELKPRIKDAGPAKEWRHPDYVGSVGLITPYAEHFCSSCNRLRVSCTGKLRLCLFGDGERSLRSWLQSPDQANELIEVLKQELALKPFKHRLHQMNPGSNRSFSAIGG